MKTHRITLLPGDGIGPEVTKAAVTVLEATGLEFQWERHELRADKDGRIPQNVIDSIRRNRRAIKGPTGTPSGKGHRSLNVQLREILDLFANIRPIRSVAGKKTRFSDVPIDIVIFRENTEGEYSGKGFSTPDSAVGISIFTKKGCERIARAAFEYARKYGRKKVTIVHKANILKDTHGLFLKTAQAVAKKYPEIICDDVIADNCMARLVQWPESFDILLCSNLIGDFISDLCAGTVGGLGFAAGFNVGKGYAVAEATHGTAPDIAGKNIANPSSIILSAAMLLDHIGEKHAAKCIRDAVYAVVKRGKHVTADVNRKHHVGTQEFAAAVARSVKRRIKLK